MKWILLILIFVGGVYYLVNQKKQEEIKKIQAEEIKKAELQNLQNPLPEAPKKEYILTLSKDTVATLRMLTEDTNEKVRLSAVELLWQMQDPQAQTIIKRMLENETETPVKIKVLEMVSKEKSKISLKLLSEGLKNYDKDTRVKCAELLGEFSTEDAIKILNSAMNDYDEDVKLKALESVNKIKKDIEQKREEKLKELQPTNQNVLSVK